jgi:aminoacylase
MLHEWCAAENATWSYATAGALHEHHLTAMDAATNPLCHRFMESCAHLGMDMEVEIFPAATDSRFLRQLKVPALGFSPMNHTPILLHEHNEMLHQETFVRGIYIYRELLQSLCRS